MFLKDVFPFFLKERTPVIRNRACELRIALTELGIGPAGIRLGGTLRAQGGGGVQRPKADTPGRWGFSGGIWSKSMALKAPKIFSGTVSRPFRDHPGT